MKKRVLALLLAGAAVASLAACGSSDSGASGSGSAAGGDGEVVELVMGNVTSSSAKDAVTEVLIPKVEEYSNGTLKIVHFPDNQLGNDEQSFAMAQTGECDIAVGSTSSVATTYNDLYVYDVPYLFLNKQEVYDVGFNGETGKAILKGPMGVTANVKLSSFTAGFLLVMVALIVVLNLVNSRSGRAIMALRDNRIAAESVGISATKYKLMAFVTSAVLAGAAGALYAMNYSSIAAKKFDFNTSILILVYVVLGGLGNIRGSVIAAALLYVLPELLRDFYDYRMLIYAIVLILVMLATNNERSKEFFSSLRRKILGRGTEKGGAQNG